MKNTGILTGFGLLLALACGDNGNVVGDMQSNGVRGGTADDADDPLNRAPDDDLGNPADHDDAGADDAADDTPVTDDDGTPPTEGEACVSPTQNTDSAYELGVKGCACDEEQDSQSVCIDGAALICEGEQWVAVEDGPCALELLCDGRLAEVEDCLHYFNTCIKMDNELFCGSGRRTDECAGEIVEGPGDCLQDDAYCTELDSGKYCTGSAAPSCPDNYVPAPDGCPDVQVFWCFQYSESLACQLQELSDEECQAAGGEPVYDPGDGSVISTGCPEDRQELGFLVPGGIEGALCCRPKQ